MTYRGLIHFHSNQSYDSILNIQDIVKKAVDNHWNLLILTDHNSINGSIKLKKEIEKQGLNIECPIAVEYNTEFGDIIVIGVETQFDDLSFNYIYNETKKKGGLLLLPHPYKGHKNIEFIASKVDLIEVFNSRIEDKYNELAVALALKYNKNVYYSSDAHLYNELNSVVVEFKRHDTLKDSLLCSTINVLSKSKTTYFNIFYSQLIKGVKTKCVKIALLNLIKMFINLLKNKLFKYV